MSLCVCLNLCMYAIESAPRSQKRSIQFAIFVSASNRNFMTQADKRKRRQPCHTRTIFTVEQNSAQIFLFLVVLLSAGFCNLMLDLCLFSKRIHLVMLCVYFNLESTDVYVKYYFIYCAIDSIAMTSVSLNIFYILILILFLLLIR